MLTFGMNINFIRSRRRRDFKQWKKINELLGNNEQGFQKDPDFRKDCWKTTFRVGVGDKKVSKENIEKCFKLKLGTQILAL